MSYSLKAVSAYLGLPPDTVRKWEARHKVVSPKRRPNGYRVYGEADLRRLLEFAKSRRAGLAAPEACRQASAATAPAPRAGDHKEALRAILAFDRRALARLYDRHAKSLGFARAFGQIWIPLLAELGSRAHGEGGIWIAAEHFSSAFLRERLLSGSGRAEPGSPRLVMAALSGDRHELGMLAALCELERRGANCVYLGGDLPLEGLTPALERLKPSGVSLTLTVRRPRKEVREVLTRLRRRFPRTKLFVCGQESLRHANLIRECGAIFVGTDLPRGVERILSELEPGEAPRR
jgi:DNA-binding transcriptional MerR regulator